MKTSGKKKTVNAIAWIILILGMIACLAAAVLADFDMKKLQSGGAYTTAVYRPEEGETAYNLTVAAADANVTLVADGGEGLRVECEENKTHGYAANYDAETRTFSVTAKKTDGIRRFFGVRFTTPKVTVYVGGTWGRVEITSENGGVFSKVPLAAESFVFGTENGDVEAAGFAVTGDAVLSSSNGEVSLSDCSAGGKIDVRSKNGELSAENVLCDRLYMQTANGTVSARADVKSGAEFYSDLGGIGVSLKGRKEDFRISAKTDLGDCNVSDTSSGDKTLTAKTDLGSIDVGFYL